MPEDDLKVTEPEKTPPEKTAGNSRLGHLKRWYIDRKQWTIPASVLLLILILALVPWTRYKVAGLVIKKDVSIYVTDSVSGDPVSAADVQLAGKDVQTGGQGYALFHHVAVGPHTATVTKKYYQTADIKVTVGFHNNNAFPAKFVATGRQVKLVIKDLVSQKPLGGVDIKVADVSAKTDPTGSALMVLPANSTSEKGSLSLNGYNTAAVDVKVADKQVTENDFTMTPTGSVYFLSKLSGKIDVVKTNLDGTDRQTVLAGTGKEDDQNTVLLASRDWKYLALYSRRAGTSPTLYLIDTTNKDSLTTIEAGTNDITLTGWVNDYFVYTVSNNSVQPWQAGQETLRSFNAQTKKSIKLDQTNASGTGSYDYENQSFGGTYGYNGVVYYILNWGGTNLDFSNKQATFNSISPDGSAKKAIHSFALANGATSYNVSVDEQVNSPTSIEFYIYDGNKDTFYTYSGGQVKPDNNETTDSFYNYSGGGHPTYLQSPSGSQTFWSEPRDGKNTLFIGDEDGQDGKQIAQLSDYNPYGWYSDNYLLVSKNSSELYIMSKDGSNVLKVSDYHKPVQTFQGYGGGYGGL